MTLLSDRRSTVAGINLGRKQWKVTRTGYSFTSNASFTSSISNSISGVAALERWFVCLLGYPGNVRIFVFLLDLLRRQYIFNSTGDKWVKNIEKFSLYEEISAPFISRHSLFLSYLTFQSKYLLHQEHSSLLLYLCCIFRTWSQVVLSDTLL